MSVHEKDAIQMKPWPCDTCGKSTEVQDSHQAQLCCDGYMCGCHGMPINPVFCKDCEYKIFEQTTIKGRGVEGNYERE